MEFFYIPVPTISNFYKSVKIALFLKFLKFLKLSSIIFMRISQTVVFTWMFLSTKVPPNLLCLVEAIVLAFILLFSSSTRTALLDVTRHQYERYSFTNSVTDSDTVGGTFYILRNIQKSLF